MVRMEHRLYDYDRYQKTMEFYRRNTNVEAMNNITYVHAMIDVYRKSLPPSSLPQPEQEAIALAVADILGIHQFLECEMKLLVHARYEYLCSKYHFEDMREGLEYVANAGLDEETVNWRTAYIIQLRCLLLEYRSNGYINSDGARNVKGVLLKVVHKYEIEKLTTDINQMKAKAVAIALQSVATGLLSNLLRYNLNVHSIVVDICKIIIVVHPNKHVTPQWKTKTAAEWTKRVAKELNHADERLPFVIELAESITFSIKEGNFALTPVCSHLSSTLRQVLRSYIIHRKFVKDVVFDCKLNDALLEIDTPIKDLLIRHGCTVHIEQREPTYEQLLNIID